MHIGSATPLQRQRLLAAGESLVRDQGAKALLLCGTDLNLIYEEDTAFSVPVIDSAQVHVDAIVDTASQNI